MSDKIAERCFLCGHYGGEGRCKRTFAVSLIVCDGRGSIRVETLPGTVPEHLEEKFQRRITEIANRFMDKVFLTIPEWAEIVDWQNANPERAECPARQARKDMGPYLKCIDGGLND